MLDRGGSVRGVRDEVPAGVRPATQLGEHGPVAARGGEDDDVRVFQERLDPCECLLEEESLTDEALTRLADTEANARAAQVQKD